eukprot:GHVP01065462.1.p1 GENE.GHVP01065462.1~~GHVP01065462.1.p1  ORF type:complete len:163 (+),score=42.12 GHVP01065462.1:57-545(+)
MEFFLKDFTDDVLVTPNTVIPIHDNLEQSDEICLKFVRKLKSFLRKKDDEDEEDSSSATESEILKQQNEDLRQANERLKQEKLEQEKELLELEMKNLESENERLKQQHMNASYHSKPSKPARVYVQEAMKDEENVEFVANACIFFAQWLQAIFEALSEESEE